MGATLSQKIWDRHVITEQPDGTTGVYRRE